LPSILVTLVEKDPLAVTRLEPVDSVLVTLVDNDAEVATNELDTELKDPVCTNTLESNPSNNSAFDA